MNRQRRKGSLLATIIGDGIVGLLFPFLYMWVGVSSPWQARRTIRFVGLSIMYLTTIGIAVLSFFIPVSLIFCLAIHIAGAVLGHYKIIERSKIIWRSFNVYTIAICNVALVSLISWIRYFVQLML